MLRNLVRGGYKTSVEYTLEFFFDRTGGFSFPCDEYGNILPLKSPEAAENLEWCRNHPEKFEFIEIRRRKYNWREPDSGTCYCGERVELVDEYCGACQCPKCGQWYNLFGQELLSPEEWEMDDDE